MQHSELSTDLISSYLATNYQIGKDADRFTLHINQYSAPLSRLLAVKQERFATIITAYNPFSQPQSNEKNLAANTKLLQVLKHYSHLVIEAINTDPCGAWPAEKSFCVLGLDLDTSKFLGRKFNQNAIVWANNSAIPQLILLR